MCYTRVLKGQYILLLQEILLFCSFWIDSRFFTRWLIAGHIALSSVTFPAGTTGYNLDILARTPLWSVGLNYK
jgi:hypothetical protein